MSTASTSVPVSASAMFKFHSDRMCCIVMCIVSYQEIQLSPRRPAPPTNILGRRKNESSQRKKTLIAAPQNHPQSALFFQSRSLELLRCPLALPTVTSPNGSHGGLWPQNATVCTWVRGAASGRAVNEDAGGFVRWEIIQLTLQAPPGPRQGAAVAAAAAFIAASRWAKREEKSVVGGGEIGSKEKREFFSATAEVFVCTK